MRDTNFEDRKEIHKRLWVEKKKVDKLVVKALEEYRSNSPEFAKTCTALAVRGWKVCIDSVDYLHVEFDCNVNNLP